jgi:S-DNA-T family DNA segregation ATPase FtsK/SpoIIIE
VSSGVELLLEVRTDAGGFDGRTFCVAVEVDRGDTVADLARALLSHARLLGVAVAPVAHRLVIVDDDRVLVANEPVRASGLLSGHTVKLVPSRWIDPGPGRVRSDPATARPDDDGTVPHNRVPYRRVVVRAAPFEPLPAPPDRPRSRKLSLVATILPMAGAVAMAVIMDRPEFLLLAVVSPVLMVHRHVSGRRSGQAGYRRERDTFLERVEARAAEIESALAAERSDRWRASPNLDELAWEAAYRQCRLWERNREAPDFLEVRLGAGRVPSLVRSSIERGGDPDLRTSADERLAHHTHVDPAPITVGLSSHAVAGAHGDAAAIRAVGTAVLVQAACLHSPDDLVVAAAVPAAEHAAHAHLWWLPHTRSSTSPLDGDHLAVGEEQTHQLLRRVLALAAARSGGPIGGSRAQPWPRVLLLLHEEAGPDRSLVARLLDLAPGVGVSVLWLGTTPEMLPRQCSALVHVADPRLGQPSRLRFTDPTLDGRAFTMEGLRPEAALRIARHLAPVRDVSASSATATIPRSIRLLDALGLPAPTAVAVLDRWGGSPSDGLRAVLGQAADGPFEVDLVHDGPHALIGGTSGAGKSELLQSLVASLAVGHPPERLTFLFIDYKGGALSAEFRDLPHNVGTVTNLDGRLALRVLTSLRAELVRRMALMEGRAKDLAELLDRAPADAPPRLVILVDEFATLVKEVPEFVDGLVDVAQRGRSLGVHLILATQRPGAAVNDNILGNTNLRIALRVVDPADSTNIVGCRDAADIPVPLQGRACARSGPGIVTAFQCAWSGAAFVETHARRAIVVRPFGPPEGTGSGHGTPVPDPQGRPTAGTPKAERRDRSSLDGTTTQLGVVVRAVADAARRSGRPAARRPWLDPLPELLTLDRVTRRLTRELVADPGRVVVIGLLDEPGSQSQRPATVDLEATGGLVVLGTGGAGKTTLLRSIATGLAQQGGPDAVQIYGLDLRQISVLPNTAEVVAGDDTERVTRLITVLSREVERRRRLLADEQAETVSALRTARSALVLPRLVLLIDGFPGLQAAFDRSDVHDWLAVLLRLVADGRQVGVHAVVTTDRRTLPTALLASMAGRLALRTAEPDEMTSFGVSSKVARDADLGPGRGFLQGPHEVQVAVVGDDPSGAGQAATIEAVARRLAAPRGTARRDRTGRGPLAGTTRPPVPVVPAPPLPELPGAVTLTAAPTGPFRVPLGLSDLDLEVVEADLTRQHVAVCGPPQSGRSTTLATVATALARSGDGLHLAGIGAGSSPLAGLDLWDAASFGRTGQVPVLEEVLDRFEMAGGTDPRAVVVLDGVEDLEAGCTPLLDRLVRAGAVRLVISANVPTLGRGHSGWLGEVRRSRTLVMLQPEGRAEVDQVGGVRPRFRPEQPFPPGRGVVIAHRRWRLVQVALSIGKTLNRHEKGCNMRSF